VSDLHGVLSAICTPFTPGGEAVDGRLPNVKYVKDTTGDFSQAATLIHDHGDLFRTFRRARPVPLRLAGGGGARPLDR
jgi:dihydrodipicolinate synthase/N-acetylneuraminate lyase